MIALQVGPTGWTTLALWLFAITAILLFVRFWRDEQED